MSSDRPMRTEPLWAPVSKIPVRRLVHAERPLCQGLAQDRGWNSEDRKWRLLFDIGEVYGAFTPDGDLISTATMTRFGPQSVAISMVLTAPRFQGQGLARRVMTEVLARSRPAVVSLYATDEGRPLYEKLGFVTYAANTLYKGRFVPDPAHQPRSRPATPNDLPALLALDADVTGSDRSNLVTRLFGFTTQLRVLERDGKVTGYAGAWRNDDNLVIGPVIADDLEDATTLIGDIASTVAGVIRLEVRADQAELGEWAARHGLTPHGVTSFMVHDGRPLPGDGDRWFVPVMVALS